MISIKDIMVLETLLKANYHPKLIELISWVFLQFGKIHITCGYRSGESGVHGTNPCRGMDLRSWIYSDPKKIVSKINKSWTYDGERAKNCALYHNAGSGAHIHLQVTDRTINRD